MNITTSRHGCRRRDFVNLANHLLKPENEAIEILEIGNSVAGDLAGVLADMEVLKNGSAAKFGLIHATINPGVFCANTQLFVYVTRTRLELDPDGERPWVAVAHVKPRAVSDAKNHAHLVIGTISTKTGKALNDYRSKQRTELIARVLEYESQLSDAVPEPPTLGRHHKAILGLLEERKLAPVAEWLVQTFGKDPDLPRSAMSSRSRQRAARLNFDLPKNKARVTALWSNTGGLSEFQAALSIAGYAVTAGKKENVWVVTDSHGNIIGALDRLLRMKRHEVHELMEASSERNKFEIESRTRIADGCAREEAVRTVPEDQPSDCGIGPSAVAVRTARHGGRARSDRSASATFRNAGRDSATASGDARSDRRENKRALREFEYGNALKQLRVLHALMNARAIYAKTAQVGREMKELADRRVAASSEITDLHSQTDASTLPRPPG